MRLALSIVHGVQIVVHIKPFSYSMKLQIYYVSTGVIIKQNQHIQLRGLVQFNSLLQKVLLHELVSNPWI